MLSSNRVNSMPRDYTKELARRPRPVVGTAAIMAEAQGTSFWVGGPVSRTSPYPTQNYAVKAKPLTGRGAANRIPPEIALKISEYLGVKDLARGAVAWRSLAMASHATPEFIRAECARFSLLIQSPSTWPPQVLRQVRDRMDQYNHAWSTLQYSDTKFFTILQTSDVTPWAGSNEWRSGNHFMGESNGYVYDACSWEAPGPAGTQMLARVCLTQVPSLRTGEVDLKRTQFNVVLSSHYVKAVTVDPVAQVVGILEYNNGYTENVYSRIPVLHVYHLKGHRLGSVQIRVGFQTGAEVYHMEMHGEMVCIVANHSTNKGTLSAIMIQNWTGAARYVALDNPPAWERWCTGFQFITEDLYIMTERSKTHPADEVLSSLIRIGHVRKNMQQIKYLTDINSEGWTPTNISLLRNISSYSPVNGPFYMNPERRLFGVLFNYKMFDGVWKHNACLFGRTTVESWLGISTAEAPERVHPLIIPVVNGSGDRSEILQQSAIYDPTNREGFAIIGRRLFWAEMWPRGWGLNLVDYNPGAGSAIQSKRDTRGDMWKSYSGEFCQDPYPVAYTATTRIACPSRIIANEDGLLIKQVRLAFPRNVPSFPIDTLLRMVPAHLFSRL
ncbi:hypothetical protein B0H11DRAFT_2123692 [Mycena galericulata]|nr:hypothetical protein B0H11DRAFT_2123692 [Mycena galericulata]